MWTGFYEYSAYGLNALFMVSQSTQSKEAIIFYQEGGSLCVVVGRQFFLPPLMAYAKKTGPPQVRPPPKTEQTSHVLPINWM